MSKTHTPTPWHMTEEQGSRGTRLFRIGAATTDNIAGLGSDDDYRPAAVQEANAALIVRAVNALPDLLAACEAMLVDVAGYVKRGGKLTDAEAHHVSLMRAAVALAKGV